MAPVTDDERKKFRQEFREAVERIQREDPEGWAEYLAETELFDNAAADGPEPDDIPAYTVREKP
ncbi:hypothetical protein [Sphaerimonospora thailandensis]|uniref:Uncharacterized protein n=1 Tax=Sphaerimonospora thailandensis TaxID=795644 RepID=A0A8J3R5K2_9ACTN|nr:hypothetical protein [Sphaerimonospora thailandensis]GIH69502.1 hypothetical protein Mth01_17550 [Sphaerimonospora thailandensis]